MPVKCDIAKCDGDGECEKICPVDPNVFQIKDGKSYIIHPEACIDCGSCIDICPQKCLSL
ncbi:4Fe-4S binding protein [Candidatus Poribacteria bacterium]|nr:4Fe-4S binding protein [Candidatus Poribacteria bacterium]